MPKQSNRRGVMQVAKAWLKRRGYHLLFAGAILSLLALVLWWSIFIRASITELHDLHHESMMQSASVLAMSMGHDPDTRPTLGIIEHDQRLEVNACSQSDPQCATVLEPHWPEYCIAPRREYEDQLEAELHSKTVMVVGESSTMLFVVLVCIFMLWRMMRLERRSHRELHEFWSRVTHELKTPITGIKAFLQTLQKRDFSREELEPLLKLALREVERQEMLAENLLVGQRIERQGLGLHARPIKLVRFVQEFIEEHRLILPDENLCFELNSPADITAQADPDALRVILENLTDNALKYGGDDPHLTFTITATAAEAQIAVSDKGDGFAPEQGERIFDAYQRLTEEQPRGRHGTGMGLYLSRQLARKMGGSLSASSSGENQGASFIITLKRTQ